MAEYIEYHPLKFWLDPASIAEIVAHIQTYLVNNPINSTTEIETIIHDYLIAHPELIGGVDSVNGQTGEVVLTADNISGGENITIKDVLDTLQDQIDDIVASIPSDYQQLINDVSDLKSAFNGSFVDGKYEISKTLPQNETVSVSYEQGTNKGGGYYNAAGEILYPTGVHKHFDAVVNGADRVYISALQDAGTNFGLIKYDGIIVETFSYHQGEAYSIDLDITKEYQVCVNAFDGFGVQLVVHYPRTFASVEQISQITSDIGNLSDLCGELFNTDKFDGLYQENSNVEYSSSGLYSFTVETADAYRGVWFKIPVKSNTNYTFNFNVAITTGNFFGDILNSSKTTQIVAQTLLSTGVFNGTLNSGANDVLYLRFSSSNSAVSKFDVTHCSFMELSASDVIKYENCVAKPYAFSGKTLYFFGDSITYGYIAAHDDVPATQANNQYPKLFAQAVGASYINYGVSGSTLSGAGDASIYTKIQNTNLSAADVVFIAGGINDYEIGVNETTLKTAVANICLYLYNNFDGDVIFITPINEAGYNSGTSPAQTLQNVRNVITRYAIMYGFSVVQGWEFPFPTKEDDPAYISNLFQDKLHPTENGYAMYAKALRTALC